MSDNIDYYYDRAEAELQMAQQATCPEAVRVHYVLAGHYLDRFYNAGVHTRKQVEASPSGGV